MPTKMLILSKPQHHLNCYSHKPVALAAAAAAVGCTLVVVGQAAAVEAEEEPGTGQEQEGYTPQEVGHRKVEEKGSDT